MFMNILMVGIPKSTKYNNVILNNNLKYMCSTHFITIEGFVAKSDLIINNMIQGYHTHKHTHTISSDSHS